MKKIAYFLMWLANKIMAKNNDPSWHTKQEMECAKEGHLWTKFDNNNDMSNPIKNRITPINSNPMKEFKYDFNSLLYMASIYFSSFSLSAANIS